MGYKRLPVCRRCVSNKDGPEEAPEKCQASLKIENPFPTRKLDDQSAENIVFLCCCHLKHMSVNRTNNITENRCSNTSRAWRERCQGKPQRTQYLRVSIWKCQDCGNIVTSSILNHGKDNCYILIYMENVLVSTFPEVEPMQIQLHSGLRRWVHICQFRKYV